MHTREITAEQVPLAMAAFCHAHRGCDAGAVEFARLTGTLVCHCAHCDDTRTYTILQASAS